jgi:hypothetical protein
LKRLAFFGLLLLGAGSLAFDLTLRYRLPEDDDWAQAAGVLRAQAKPGDAVQIWPPWAEQARLFVDSMPVLAEEDLAHGDYLGVQRLWVLSLPRAPLSRSFEPRLRERAATPIAAPQRFGALALQAWDLRAPGIAAQLTPLREKHEVDYVARPCVPVRIGTRYQARGVAGAALHVRAGVIGERAYDRDRTPVRVHVFVDGDSLGDLYVPPTLRDGTGWRRFDTPLPPGPAERQFTFSIESPDTARPFCLLAWTTK